MPKASHKDNKQPLKNVGRHCFPLIKVHLFTDWIPRVNGDPL